MRYGEGLLEEILRRTDLVQLVGRRVKLTRKGRVFWGVCPFHKEKTPSFKVESERRNYKCFGCGAGGDAFKWLIETEGLAFPEAVERLAQEAGVELPKWTPLDEAREQQKKSLYAAIEAACVFYEQQLRTSAGDAARKYLQSRGLGEDTWTQFRLGYAPAGRNALIQQLKKHGFAEDDAVAAGLARGGEDGQAVRDFFFDRVIFPIGDTRGRIVAFGARTLQSENTPKYINTGETALFSKGKLLYNFASARAAALKTGNLVVAEGYLDVIALVRAGFEAAVAPLGTALTDDHLALLWKSASEPVLSFDGDEAGRRAALRAAELALPQLTPGHSLRFAFLPAGDDPDSLIRAQGPGAMQSVLGSAIPLVEMVWQTEAGRTAIDTPERKADLVLRLNERLRAIPSTEIRQFYLSALVEIVSRELGLRAYASGDLLRISASIKRPPGQKNAQIFMNAKLTPALKASKLLSARQDRASTAHNPGAPLLPQVALPMPRARDPAFAAPAARRLKEIELLALLLDAPEIIERHYEQLAALPLADSSLDNLRHELLQVAASGRRLETGTLEGHLERAGMGQLVERLKPRRVPRSAESDLQSKSIVGGEGDVGEFEARWLRAAAQLWGMAESDAERRHVLERYRTGAGEKS